MMSSLHQNDTTRKLAKPSSIITIDKGSQNEAESLVSDDRLVTMAG